MQKLDETTIHGIIDTLREHGVEPDADYTADAGSAYGYVEAFRLSTRLFDGQYAIAYGDNAQTNFDLTDDADNLYRWLLPGGDGSDLGDDRLIAVANVRGIDAITPASSIDEGPFRVIVTCDFYGPTSTSKWAFDDNDHEREFATLDDAQAWIDETEGETYQLSHNESNAPTYTIVTLG